MKLCSTFFNILSVESRLKIIVTLSEGDKSVSEICDSVKVERTNVSHQLNLLRGCNIVLVRREGKKKIYSLNRNTMKPILDLAGRHVEKSCKRRLRKESHVIVAAPRSLELANARCQTSSRRRR